MCACSAVSSSLSLPYASLRYWISLLSDAVSSAMQGLLPGYACKEPCCGGCDAHSREREHERHDGQVPSHPREQQSADEADAREQQCDGDELPAPAEREQRKAAQAQREHDVV